MKIRWDGVVVKIPPNVFGHSHEFKMKGEIPVFELVHTRNEKHGYSESSSWEESKPSRALFSCECGEIGWGKAEGEEWVVRQAWWPEESKAKV